MRRDPNDPSALAGLGIVRLRQHRLPQARELLGRASSEYRRVLASNPQDQSAQAGLRGALAAERSAETAGLAPRSAGPGIAINPARARADALRAEGRALEAQGDVPNAGAKYQEAIAVDPTDPWARVDYARFLAHRGDVAQGFVIVDPLASGGTAESLYATALFYNEMNRPAEALAFLDAVDDFREDRTGRFVEDDLASRFGFQPDEQIRIVEAINAGVVTTLEREATIVGGRSGQESPSDTAVPAGHTTQEMDGLVHGAEQTRGDP